MKVANPYADLRALLDATRQLTPEEMAELQLEQGYVDRALRIYDELTRREPGNASYATRRAWLARMASVRPVRAVGPSGPGPSSAPGSGCSETLHVVRASSAPDVEPEPGAPEATLRGLGPLSGPDARDEEPSVVRALRIVRVR